MKSLVIVESPAKAKTIEKYLGADYVVTSSYGHIRDLPKKGMSIDIENDFKPTYEISSDKKERVKELKKLTKESEAVLLATDEDREGEAIAWHLYEALDLKKKDTKRIVFHEITKQAIQKAVQNPRDIDLHLVDAQQARRVLDRLVGYELSPVLWKKVQRGLSAGRVQSVAVRIIVEREREITAFVPQIYYKVTAEFNVDGKTIKAELKDKFETIEEARAFVQKTLGSEYKVENLEKKPAKKSPSSPFTTSTLQQEASRKLGFTVKQTMVVAQKLYEAGKITYMRTDSMNLSEVALADAKEFIIKSFGEDYYKRRTYKTNSANAQEAHEAIRPTNMFDQTVTGDNNEVRLYELIWKRTVATQMADAELERTIVTIGISKAKEKLVSTAEIIVFDGCLKLYLEGTDDEDENDENSKLLPPLETGQLLDLQILKARQTFTKPPPRYTEASLVKKLEEMGIGRPSTYAPTISTVIDRGYVEKADREGVIRNYMLILSDNREMKETQENETVGAERKKLFPTDMGAVVTDFLTKNFPSIVDYNFTRLVEEEFDEIANGTKKWNKMISDFYAPFSETVKQSEAISRREAVQDRIVGEDPETGKTVYAKIGRYGPYVQLGENDEENKPKMASLLKTQRLETITMDEAMELFRLPRKLGTNEAGLQVSVAIGRFGPYVACGKTFVSIRQEEVFSVTLEEALEKVRDKEEKKANSLIKEWEEEGIKVQIGRYGPYITDGKKNARVPKDTEPGQITLEQAKKLLDETTEKKGRGGRTAGRTAKKTK